MAAASPGADWAGRTGRGWPAGRGTAGEPRLPGRSTGQGRYRPVRTSADRRYAACGSIAASPRARGRKVNHNHMYFLRTPASPGQSSTATRTLATLHVLRRTDLPLLVRSIARSRSIFVFNSNQSSTGVEFEFPTMHVSGATRRGAARPGTDGLDGLDGLHAEEARILRQPANSVAAMAACCSSKLVSAPDEGLRAGQHGEMAGAAFDGCSSGW